MATTGVVDAEPAGVDLKLTEGNDLRLEVEFDLDITGFTNWKAQIRAAPTVDSPVAVELTPDYVDIAARVIAFTAPGSAIVTALDGYGYDVQALPDDGATAPRTYVAGRLEVIAKYTH